MVPKVLIISTINFGSGIHIGIEISARICSLAKYKKKFGLYSNTTRSYDIERRIAAFIGNLDKAEAVIRFLHLKGPIAMGMHAELLVVCAVTMRHFRTLVKCTGDFNAVESTTTKTGVTDRHLIWGQKLMRKWKLYCLLTNRLTVEEIVKWIKGSAGSD